MRNRYFIVTYKSSSGYGDASVQARGFFNRQAFVKELNLKDVTIMFLLEISYKDFKDYNKTRDE